MCCGYPLISLNIFLYQFYITFVYLCLYLHPILIYPSCCAAVVCHRKERLCLGDPAVFTGKVSTPGTCRPLVNALSESHGLILKPDLRPSFSSSTHPSGQLISATTEEIVKAYYPSYFLLSVAGQIQTRQAQANYDDSYLGKSAPGFN